MVDTSFELGREILVVSHPSNDHFLIIRPVALKGLRDFVEHTAFATCEGPLVVVPRGPRDQAGRTQEDKHGEECPGQVARFQQLNDEDEYRD